MKILRIIILVALVVSFMPLDAFCDDHSETTEHHHGVVLCHASCHGAVLTSNTTVKLQDTTSYVTPTNGIKYEGPFLPIDVRPPLSLLS